MERVTFTQMKHGTAEEYHFLSGLEEQFCQNTADRLLAELRRQGEDSLGGYRVTRLEHALQCATRARRDGADDDWIFAALFHDIADGIAPRNHDRTAAEILRPYVREDVCWVVANHGLFQTYYYGHHVGWDRNARDKFRNHPLYQPAVDFCERWDQSSFDEQYDTEPLESFIPIVKAVLGRKPYWYMADKDRRQYG